MKRLILPLLASAWLVGCTPLPSPHDAMARANQEFAGRDIGEFFISYGSPIGSKIAPDGSKSYRWISIESINAPSSGYLISPAGHYAIPPEDTNGEMIGGYCEIRIKVDAQEHIQKLILINDSIGKYSGSRCAEIFSQAP